MAEFSDRWGVQAVFGRTPRARELRSMAIASAVVDAYQAREQAGNWADWAARNPTHNELLNLAEREANGAE